MATTDETPRTLVLGLGNPILRDDGVGLLVAREVKRLLGGWTGVEVREASLGGFELLEQLSGFERVIIVDAIKTAEGKPGQVHRLKPEDFFASERFAAAHEIDLPTALALGRMMNVDMPNRVVIFGIEIQDGRTFGETCCPAVAAAVAPTAAKVLQEITRADPA